MLINNEREAEMSNKNPGAFDLYYMESYNKNKNPFLRLTGQEIQIKVRETQRWNILFFESLISVVKYISFV